LKVPPEKNLVKAGDFEGDCLQAFNGDLWRAVNRDGWNNKRAIQLDRTDGSTLLLKSLNPKLSDNIVGCYQVIESEPPKGGVLVLRYRAKSEKGQGQLSIYAGLPLTFTTDRVEDRPPRIRRFGSKLAPDPNNPTGSQWMYRSPTWITPTKD